MRWTGMVGLARAVAVAAALALVLCDLSSRPGVTPAQAGFFSKAKKGAKDKESSKDKDKDEASSSSSSSTTKSKSGGFFSKTKKPPASSGGASSTATRSRKPDPGGLFSRSTRPTRPTLGSHGTATVARPRGSGGGYFSRTSSRRKVPVWKPSSRPGGFFSSGSRSSSTQRRSAHGYFSQVKRLKARSHHGYYTAHHPRVVDWWWWWYPYDLRYYHWHFGYYDPFAPDYAFIFVYVGRPHHPYPYYVYYPPPRSGVIVITRWTDRDDGYYAYSSRAEGALGEAVRDIERAWRSEEIGRLMDHVDPGGTIRVYYRDTFSHTMTAREFEDLSLEAFDTMRTVSMRLDRVTRLSGGWAKARGRHTFYDANGDRRVVYVYYLLEEVRDGWRREWLIREIGQGPEPY